MVKGVSVMEGELAMAVKIPEAIPGWSPEPGLGCPRRAACALVFLGSFHRGAQPGAGGAVLIRRKDLMAPGVWKAEGKAQKLGLGALGGGPTEPWLNLGRNFAGLGVGRWLRKSRRRCSTLFTGTCRSEGKPEAAFPQGEVRVRRGRQRAKLGPREGGWVRWRMDPDAPEETNAGPSDLVVLLDASSQEASSTTPVLAPHPLNSFIVPTS